jgi:tRNA U34 2-thiouridine synthase MnmA/TrmU
MNEEISKYRGHAIALYSGGLDSTLAIILMLRQNIRVTALTFLTQFGCDIMDKSSCGSDPYPAAKKFGFEVKLMHLGEKFIEMVKAPEHGYGKNMNPCIDCRILMLREARQFMEMVGADFIITGEVLGQRPMSQMRPSLNMIEKASSLKGLLVRPLSGRLLEETIPEKKGVIDRELMENISGRSRKRQMELAREFGLESYPAPAAGCLLTDIGYSNRLRDLLRQTGDISANDLNLLRVGRHFRLNEKVKLIVGRDESDNDKIEKYSGPDQIRLEALGTGSPVALLIGDVTDADIQLAASITARYCDKKNMPSVEITLFMKEGERKIDINPADPVDAGQYIIR